MNVTTTVVTAAEADFQSSGWPSRVLRKVSSLPKVTWLVYNVTVLGLLMGYHNTIEIRVMKSTCYKKSKLKYLSNDDYKVHYE